MINTLTEVKTLLGISNTTNDAYISALIPLVDQAICSHCNNDFILLDKYGYVKTYIDSNTFSFVKNTNSIDSSEINLNNYNFAVGDSVRVFNSENNNQLFTINSIETTKIIFESIDSVKDEDAGNFIIIVKVEFPRDLKLIAADLINWKLQSKKVTPGLKAVKFDDYSATFADNQVKGFPISLMSSLYDYRIPYYKGCPI